MKPTTKARRRPGAPRRSSRAAIGLALLGAIIAIAGCGEAIPGEGTQASRTQADAAGETTTATPPASTPAPTTASTPTQTALAPRNVVAKIDASSDQIVAEGKLHVAAGAPSDAEIRKEIEAARRAGIVLPSGDSASSFENAQSSSRVPVGEVEVPQTPWNPRGKPIADWIIPVLQWASLHGWSGTVTSGYRTFYEQAQLNAAGAFSARAGLSNHETTKYPGGAVDVTEPSQLISVLRNYNGSLKLIGGVLGPVDPEHFSATGD